MACRTHSPWKSCAQHRRTVEQLGESERDTTKTVAAETLMLAQSNYEVRFAPESDLSERVLFPVTPSRATGSRCSLCSLHNEDGATNLTMRLTQRMTKDDPAPVSRNVRFSSFQIHHVERPGRRE